MHHVLTDIQGPVDLPIALTAIGQFEALPLVRAGGVIARWDLEARCLRQQANESIIEKQRQLAAKRDKYDRPKGKVARWPGKLE